MTVTEINRRSDSLYWGEIGRRELCDRVAYLESDLERVKAENAKLRKLVRDMYTLATDHGMYVRYPYCDAWDEKLAVVEKQMRELGVEVDG